MATERDHATSRGPTAPVLTGRRPAHEAREPERSLLVRWRPPMIPRPRPPSSRSVEPGQHVRRELPTLWCVDRERGIPRGAEAFLLSTGPHPGLVARGSVCCWPFLAARSDRIGTVGQHVIIEWVEVLPLPGAIPIELHASISRWGWTPSDSSAESLPAEFAEWIRHVWELGTQRQQEAAARVHRPRHGQPAPRST